MHTPLYEQIFDYIVTEIREGRLRSGNKVMSERELADKFGVSTMTSKGALARLAALGIIVRSRGKGSFVAKEIPDLPQNLYSHSRDASDGNDNEDIQRKSHDADGSADSGLIGLIIPGFSDAFGAELVRAIEERCFELGMHVILRFTKGLRSVEDDAIQDLMHLGVKGLLIMPVHGEHYSWHILRLTLDRFPTVLLDRYLKGIPMCAVYTDNVAAAREITAHVLDHGHRHVAFISPPPDDTSSIVDRLSGFIEAFNQRGMAIMPQYVFTDLHATLPMHEVDRTELIQCDTLSLFDFVKSNREITAFVACEYENAILLMNAMQQLDLQVPQDRSIVCFDHYNHFMVKPFFTHVRQDEHRMGRQAVDCLMQNVRGENVIAPIMIPHRIVPSSSLQVLK